MTDRPQDFSPYPIKEFSQDDLRNATAENEAKGDPKARPHDEPNALVAEQFAFREPEAQGDYPMRVLGDDGRAVPAPHIADRSSIFNRGFTLVK